MVTGEDFKNLEGIRYVSVPPGRGLGQIHLLLSMFMYSPHPKITEGWEFKKKKEEGKRGEGFGEYKTHTLGEAKPDSAESSWIVAALVIVHAGDFWTRIIYRVAVLPAIQVVCARFASITGCVVWHW